VEKNLQLSTDQRPLPTFHVLLMLLRSQFPCQVGPLRGPDKVFYSRIIIRPFIPDELFQDGVTASVVISASILKVLNFEREEAGEAVQTTGAHPILMHGRTLAVYGKMRFSTLSFQN